MVAQLKKVDAPWLWKRWPTILVIIALSLLIFGFPPALPTSTLGVGTRLEISTDKSEYTVGEKINATFYTVNILPLPVRLDPYNTVEFSAYIGGIPQGGTQVGHIT